MNYRTKGILSNIVGIILIILAIALVVSFVSSFFDDGDDTWDKVSVSWTVGGLKEDGTFDSDVTSQMVSERIEIDGGLKISPDFRAGLTYAIYFYDDNDHYISNVTQLTIISEMTPEDVVSNDGTGATYYRIIVTPDDENGKINAFEKFKYAGQIDVFTTALANVT